MNFKIFNIIFIKSFLVFFSWQKENLRNEHKEKGNTQTLQWLNSNNYWKMWLLQVALPLCLSSVVEVLVATGTFWMGVIVISDLSRSGAIFFCGQSSSDSSFEIWVSILRLSGVLVTSSLTCSLFTSSSESIYAREFYLFKFINKM